MDKGIKVNPKSPKNKEKDKKVLKTAQVSGGVNYPFDDGVDGGAEDNKRLMESGGGGVVDITCDINHGKSRIPCKRDKEGTAPEVYIPFSFIHKHFEIYGKLEDAKEGEEQTFTWLHSLVKIFRPSVPYNPKGVFTYFENYNVEVRDRVKCISGAEGKV